MSDIVSYWNLASTEWSAGGPLYKMTTIGAAIALVVFVWQFIRMLSRGFLLLFLPYNAKIAKKSAASVLESLRRAKVLRDDPVKLVAFAGRRSIQMIGMLSLICVIGFWFDGGLARNAVQLAVFALMIRRGTEALVTLQAIQAPEHSCQSLLKTLEKRIESMQALGYPGGVEEFVALRDELSAIQAEIGAETRN